MRQRYLKQSPSLFNALKNCFIRPRLIWSGGSNPFDGFANGTCKILFSPTLKFSHLGQISRTQCCWRARLSHKHKKHGYLVNPLCFPSRVQITFHSPHIIQLCSLYLIFFKTKSIVWWLSFKNKEYPVCMDAYWLPLLSNTHFKLDLELSTNNLQSRLT